MNQEVLDYVAKAREGGASDAEIKKQLLAFHWSEDAVESAMKADPKLPVPPPPPPPSGALPPTPTPGAPVAVVKNFTTRGLEYIIMFIALWVTSFSFAWLLHSLVDNWLDPSNSAYTDTFTSFATPALIVALPIFSYLFLRLKKAEQTEANLRQDPSRRHAVQLTLVVTFIIGIIDVIAYLYSLMNGSSTDTLIGSSSSNGLADFMHMLVTLLVAGGIFYYYWRDIHQKD